MRAVNATAVWQRNDDISRRKRRRRQPKRRPGLLLRVADDAASYMARRLVMATTGKAHVSTPQTSCWIHRLPVPMMSNRPCCAMRQLPPADNAAHAPTGIAFTAGQSPRRLERRRSLPSQSINPSTIRSDVKIKSGLIFSSHDCRRRDGSFAHQRRSSLSYRKRTVQLFAVDCC